LYELQVQFFLAYIIVPVDWVCQLLGWANGCSSHPYCEWLTVCSQRLSFRSSQLRCL